MGTNKVKATVGGREFEDVSWNGLVSRVVAAFHLNLTPAERVSVAQGLLWGIPQAVSPKLTITPVR